MSAGLPGRFVQQLCEAGSVPAVEVCLHHAAESSPEALEAGDFAGRLVLISLFAELELNVVSGPGGSSAAASGYQANARLGEGRRQSTRVGIAPLDTVVMEWWSG